VKLKQTFNLKLTTMRRTNLIEPSVEQITAIVKSTTTPEQKERQLIAIGLPQCDAYALAYFNRYNNSENAAEPLQTDAAEQVRQALANYTIGVEIECFARNIDIVTNCRANGVECQTESYNHTDNATHFKLVSDSSVVGLPNSTECVSPILRYGVANETFRKLCTALEQSNAQVNKSCGLHVHIGAQNLSDREYCNVFVNYMYLSNLIEKTLAPSRRGTRWAKNLINQETRVLAANNKYQMAVALYHDRYYQVNVMAYERHQTIEFRQHQGTTDYEKITNWLAFCVKLVEWSKTNRLSRETAPQTIDEIEFLNDTEKQYFKRRAAHFAERENTAAAA
jgi:hypothetical protein